MTQHLFDDMIGTPPPSTVNVPALVRRERRARIARRAGYGMTAMMALAIATAGVAGVSRSPSDPNDTRAVTQPQQSQDKHFQLLASSKESADATAKRLSQTLDRALKQTVATAKWVNIKASDASNPTADGLPNIVPIFLGPNHPGNYFSGTVNVENDGRQGHLDLALHPQAELGKQYPKKPRFQLECAGEAGCKEGISPDGKKIITTVGENEHAKWQEIRVEVADNRLLIISVAMDVDPNNVQTLPLTVAQTTAIAVYMAGRIKA